MSRIPTEEALMNLTVKEAECLYYYCLGLSYRKIAEKIGYSEPNIGIVMRGVQKKLGIDALKSDKGRRQVLERYYCPALKQMVGNDPDFKEWPPKGWPPKTIVFKSKVRRPKHPPKIPGGTPIYGQPPQPLEEDIEEEIEEETEEEERQEQIRSLRKVEPIKIITYPQPPIRRRNWIWVAIVGACLGVIACAAVAGFLYGRITNPPLAPVIPTNPPLVVQTEVPIVVVPTDIPTAIPTTTSPPPPTDTAGPTNTPAPTPTPPYTVLFEDNFDNGLSPMWNLISGKPIIANGVLTTDDELWLTVGEPSWKNYEVSFYSEPRECFIPYSKFIFGLHAQDLDNYVFLNITRCEVKWNITINGSITVIEETRFIDWNGGFYNWRITAVNGNYAVYTNGEKRASYYDTSFSDGYIMIRLDKGSIIDDFRVTQLP